jgi:hypothetical protein
MNPVSRPVGRPRQPPAATLIQCLSVSLMLALPINALAQVYRWVDAEGVTHLSSQKPPPGVKAERLDVPGSSRPTGSRSGSNSVSRSSAGSPPRPTAADPARVAEREDVLGRLRTRECVIAIEALERKTGGSEVTSAADIKRLKQTADLNCSQDPSRRREQEAMAARHRMANSPACDVARDQLWQMLEPGSNAPRERVRSQQAYVDEHCTSPVR